MQNRRARILTFLGAGLIIAGGVSWAVGWGANGGVILGPHDGHELPAIDLERIALGDIAPDFTLESYGGGTVTLSEFRGEKNVLLVFYRGHW